MIETFGRNYADAYDAIYRLKDYDGEVDLIERILVRHGLDGPRRLLDLGCGTGNHALPWRNAVIPSWGSIVRRRCWRRPVQKLRPHSFAPSFSTRRIFAKSNSVSASTRF